MKPKPNPDTQARVDATDQAALAKMKADTAELTLAHWRAMCENAGVRDVRFAFDDKGGIRIVLRGVRNRRTVEIDQTCPAGQPFPLHAVLALHAFDNEITPDAPYLGTPHTMVGEGTPEAHATPPVLEVERTATGEIDHVSIEGRVEVPEKCAHDPADRAAEIAKRARPVDIYKPPPAGAGQRRPLSLPLCKVCKAQPVYNASAEFCGAECARKFYTDKAAQAVKGSR